MSWAEYWNRKTPIYVNDRHRRVHYETVSRDLIRCLPGPGARVVDYGCGDTLCARRVADGCAHLFLCDSSPVVRESLAARYGGCPNISVIAPDQFDRLDTGTIDAIVINSVIQYLSAAEFARLLSVSREKLSRGGRLVLGDVVPRRVGPLRDALELLKLAAGNGFLLAAAVGLVKSFFSDYPRLRRAAGFLRFEEAEIRGELERAGFAAERYRPNIGHNSARMTFLAVVRADGGATSMQPASEPGARASVSCPPSGNPVAAAAGPEGLAGPQMPTFVPQDHRIAACVFAVAWLFLSLPWLSGQATIPYDAKALFQAQLQFLANALHSGQSPFWNPNTFVGVPQIADPQSLIFSPAILLAFLDRAPSSWQLDVFVLSLLCVGGLAILKFCQDRGWHPAGGAVAAIAFAFGAAAAWRIQHVAQIQSLAFFAIALWLMARALDRSSAPLGALAGLAAGLMLAEPDQVAFLAAYVLAGYCAGHWLLAPDRLLALRRSVRPLTWCALAAAACAALPVLLTYLFLEASNRPEIAFSEAARGSLHPASLLTGVVAGLFGAIEPGVEYWGPYSEAWDKNELTLSYNMSQVYLGTLPILLILTVGVMRGALWSREIRFFGIAAAALLIYALGRHTPAFAIFFGYLPGISLFRRPVDGVFLVGALLSVAAGYLVHLWATATLPFASYRKRILEAGLIVAILLTALATAWSAGGTALAVKPLMLAVAWIAVTSLLLAAPAAWRGRTFAVVAPALVLASDLARHNGPNEATALPHSSFEVLNRNCRCETIRFLKAHVRRADGSPWRDRVELVGLGFEWQNAALVHGLEGTLGYNPFRLGDVSDATGARDYIAGADQKTFAPLFPSYASMMADLLGLRFIAVGVPIEEVDARLKPGALKLVARTAEAYVYENPRALPRVLFAKDWQMVDFRALVASGEWPRFDPMRTVLLDEAPDVDDAVVRLARHPSVGSNVRIRHYENTRVVIDVQAERPGFVVLHDVWHPWWTADIDGVEAPILRANVLFRAVPVPAGQHVLTFEFKPLSGVIEDLADRFALDN